MRCTRVDFCFISITEDRKRHSKIIISIPAPVLLRFRRICEHETSICVGSVVVWWCGGGVEVWWCGVVWCGGEVVWWCGVVVWWCGVMVWWCGGEVVWWCGVVVWWCGGEVVGGMVVPWYGCQTGGAFSRDRRLGKVSYRRASHPFIFPLSEQHLKRMYSNRPIQIH